MSRGIIGKSIGAIGAGVFRESGRVLFGKAGGRFFGKTGECFSEKRQAGERGDVFCFLLFFCYLLAYFGKKQ